MKRTKQENYIQFIYDELIKGNVVYNEVFKVFLSSFKCSEPTFVTYWKIANERYKTAQISLQDKVEDMRVKNELNTLQGKILTRNKIVELMTNAVEIAYEEVQSNPTPSSIDAFNKTIANYCKLEGFNKPDKVAETDSEGKDKDVTITIVKTYEK
jgi:hypothetical protein